MGEQEGLVQSDPTATSRRRGGGGEGKREGGVGLGGEDGQGTRERGHLYKWTGVLEEYHANGTAKAASQGRDTSPFVLVSIRTRPLPDDSSPLRAFPRAADKLERSVAAAWTGCAPPGGSKAKKSGEATRYCNAEQPNLARPPFPWKRA